MKQNRLSTLFYAGFTVMELSYLYILASLLDGPVYSFILMLLLYPFALLSKLALPRSVFSRRLIFTLEVVPVTLVILLVTGERLVSSLATGPADIQGIILRTGLCGFIWLMGYTLYRKRVNFHTVTFRLQIGIIAVMALSQIAGRSSLVFLFFMIAPVALFLARWSSSFSYGATVLRTPSPKHLLLAAASVMLSGTALILLFSPGVVVSWLGDIGGGISDWATAPQKPATEPSTPSIPSKSGFFNCRPRTETGGISPSESPSNMSGGTTWIDNMVIWIIIVTIFIAIVVLIAFAFRRRSARRKAHSVEQAPFQIQMVSLGVIRSLISLLPQLLNKLWIWLISLFNRYRKHPESSEEALISIRALYRNLLRWADRQGVARVPSQTPIEHLLIMEQRFPQQHDDLKQVVDLYLLSRYSRQPIFQEEFDRARKAWQRALAYSPSSGK